MIDTVIIEDEKRSANLLKNILKEYCPNVNLLGEAASVETGLELFTKVKPALVFLDVQMPDGTGFDLLEKLPEKKFQIIFTTAHDHYALRAIKFSAIDYLLKPISIVDVKAAVEKVVSKSSDDVIQNNISLLIKNLSGGVSKQPDKIALPTMNGHVFVNINDIIRFEAEGSYTYVCLVNKEKVLVSRTLKEFENFVDENEFVRIHHAHLVNMHHVKNYVKGSGGYVVMSDGSTAEVSVRKKDEFFRKMRIH